MGNLTRATNIGLDLTLNLTQQWNIMQLSLDLKILWRRIFCSAAQFGSGCGVFYRYFNQYIQISHNSEISLRCCLSVSKITSVCTIDLGTPTSASFIQWPSKQSSTTAVFCNSITSIECHCHIQMMDYHLGWRGYSNSLNTIKE